MTWNLSSAGTLMAPARWPAANSWGSRASWIRAPLSATALLCLQIATQAILLGHFSELASDCFDRLALKRVTPLFTAGLSLGEYTALACVSGVIELEGLLEAVFHRGSKMHDIVPRDEYATTRLADGDVLEVVQFVGGG